MTLYRLGSRRTGGRCCWRWGYRWWPGWPAGSPPRSRWPTCRAAGSTWSRPVPGHGAGAADHDRRCGHRRRRDHRHCVPAGTARSRRSGPRRLWNCGRRPCRSARGTIPGSCCRRSHVAGSEPPVYYGGSAATRYPQWAAAPAHRPVGSRPARAAPGRFPPSLASVSDGRRRPAMPRRHRPPPPPTAAIATRACARPGGSAARGVVTGFVQDAPVGGVDLLS